VSGEISDAEIAELTKSAASHASAHHGASTPQVSSRTRRRPSSRRVKRSWADSRPRGAVWREMVR
jgi:hypothetical protein